MTITLSGLRSQWTMPAWCNSLRRRHTASSTASHYMSFRHRIRPYWSMVRPYRCSITMMPLSGLVAIKRGAPARKQSQDGRLMHCEFPRDVILVLLDHHQAGGSWGYGHRNTLPYPPRPSSTIRSWGTATFNWRCEIMYGTSCVVTSMKGPKLLDVGPTASKNRCSINRNLENIGVN